MSEKSLVMCQSNDGGSCDARDLRAAVVHDFNNLLTPVINIMTELQRQQVGTPRQLARIEGAMFCAFRASALARQLLDASGIGHVIVEPVRPASLLALVDAFMGLAPSIRYMIDFPEDLPDALVDRGLMERTLLNLAINACDAMPSGGTLTISGSVETRLPDATRMIRLSVKDTGHGMTPEMLERILDNRISTKKHGTGLGLAMVRNAIERQRGAMTIFSAPGHGTVIDLWLRLAEQAGTS